MNGTCRTCGNGEFFKERIGFNELRHTNEGNVFAYQMWKKDLDGIWVCADYGDDIDGFFDDLIEWLTYAKVGKHVERLRNQGVFLRRFKRFDQELQD